jgi:predicted N-formylglutamate amidohydrolase
MQREVRMLVTCEHGGNRIPARYRALFEQYAEALEGHRGYDVGALAVARDLTAAFSRSLSAVLFYSTTSRLLVDLNRSVGHPRLHGEAVRGLDPAARRDIVASYHKPYRTRVQGWVRRVVEAGSRVLHVSSHSFTPSLDGKERDADLGLLFDPQRASEALLAGAWHAALRRACPALRVRLNYPYRGRDDGMTTTMRRAFDDAHYVGIELEVNQRYPTGDARRFRALRWTLVETLRDAADPALAAPQAGDPTKRPDEGVKGAA